VEGITIRRFRRIGIQHLCSEHPSWVRYLFLGKSERFHKMIILLICIIHEALNLKTRGRCLCVKEGKEHGKKIYLFLCNGEWLKVVWILMFLVVVCST
jgi:hypothetical protein